MSLDDVPGASGVVKRFAVSDSVKTAGERSDDKRGEVHTRFLRSKNATGGMLPAGRAVTPERSRGRPSHGRVRCSARVVVRPVGRGWALTGAGMSGGGRSSGGASVGTGTFGSRRLVGGVMAVVKPVVGFSTA